MSVNPNQKQILSIVIVAVIAVSLVVILKTVPLKTVTEDYGSQSLSLGGSEKASTTLVTKKGWTVSGSYSTSSTKGSVSQYAEVSFYIYSSDGKTTIFERTKALSGTFSFISDNDSSYIVRVLASNDPYLIVTLEAKQTGITTII